MGYGLWWLVDLEHGKRLVDRQPLHRHVIMTAQQPTCGVNFRGLKLPSREQSGISPYPNVDSLVIIELLCDILRFNSRSK